MSSTSGSSTRFGAGWSAWWKGGAVEKAMQKSVSRALRVLAFETRKKAQERIIRRPFGHELKATKRGTYKLVEDKRYITLYRIVKGGSKFMRGKPKTYKHVNGFLLYKTRARLYQRSKPGQSPTNQRGVLRGSILYAFRENSGLLESFTGAIAMQSSGGGRLAHQSMTDGMASHALEYGGYSRNHQGRMVRIAARPFMRPAADEVLKSSLLRAVLGDSLMRSHSGSTPSAAMSARYGQSAL